MTSSTSKRCVAVDDVIYSLGWWGRFQKVQFLNTMLPVVACALHVMSVIFIGRAVEHQCTQPENLNASFGGTNDDLTNASHGHSWALNETIVYESCSIVIKNGSEVIKSSKCPNGYTYSEDRQRSFVSEWDLVCDREYLSDVSQTVLAVGMSVGAFIFTALADVYGRKPMYMLTHFLLFSLSVAIAFLPDFNSFVVFRFFLGAFQQGVGLTSNVLIMELMPTEKRAFPSQVGSFVWPGSLMLLGFCAFVTKESSWRVTELLLSAFSLYVFVQWWFVEESLRWLVAEGKMKEAEVMVRKAAKANGVKADHPVQLLKSCGHGEISQKHVPLQDISRDKGIGDLDPIPSSDTAPNGKDQGERLPFTPQDDKIQLSAFVKNKNVFILTAMIAYVWFTDSLAYYGLIMTSPSLTHNFYLGYTLNILVEFPAAVAFLFLVNRIGRKPFMVFFHLLGGLSLLATVILSSLSLTKDLPGIDTVILCISLVGKFGISTAFAVLFLYTPELYPTKLRNTGFGLSSVFARLSGMLAPYSRTFARHIPWGPGAVFSCLCLLVPFLIRFLPETQGVELPQTMEEFDVYFERASSKRKKSGSANL